MKKTLGGERIGSGNKMKVDMKTYNRSTHDLGYIWRSTMSSGTLVPFMSELALPGDTFDINLDCDIKTHPTVGPLFGSYKVQLDLYECPIRLYQGLLHNNALGIGMNMSNVKLPLYRLTIPAFDITSNVTNLNNTQINPSCLLAYLGVRGVGYNGTVAPVSRDFNAIPLLAYWDIYKNYYANKQEEIGAVIHTNPPALVQSVDTISMNAPDGTSDGIPEAPAESVNTVTHPTAVISIDTIAGPQPNANMIMFDTSIGRFSLSQLASHIIQSAPTLITAVFNWNRYGEITIFNWSYRQKNEPYAAPPEITTFPLSSIDDMRNELLRATGDPGAVIINTLILAPYAYVIGNNADGIPFALGNQEGLGLKTYQSDLLNNWLKTEWIDGPNGITEITAIDTTGGSFTIDTLNLSRKVYDMLNRIAVSGGSYNDWIDAVYQENKYTRCESPIYHGGLIKELVFQEVVSNSSSMAEGQGQPLGTLAGKGVMAKKHKGGGATIKISEPCYIIGIISLTPRVDYSQGNKWDAWLLTMDDFHKPALDEIGFQELIQEQMAWWSTQIIGGVWTQESAGKQPAWMNYMTNINRTYGNFAIEQNEMFMTLNRRYEHEAGLQDITDLTTYIDPAKFNQIFAQTSLDSQNFWAQIAVDITARRLMSARIMPNL